MNDSRQKVCRGSLKRLYRENAGDNSILIVSATALRKTYDTRLFTLKDTTSRQIVWGLNKPFDEYLKFGNADTYIGFGGGTALDIAKYLATNNDARCIAVPSMLSTNAFATNKVAKVTSDNKVTVDAVLPHEIWYDDEILALSKTENIYGLADAFSIYTALYDWETSSEPINNEIFKRAWNTYMDALEYTQRKKKSQREIFDILLEAGYVTNDYGSGRPESGSEHIIAKEIEKLIKIPHALAVVCGISIISVIQNRPQDEIRQNRTAFDSMGIFKAIRNRIPSKVLEQALMNTRPRHDRETCLNGDCFIYVAEDKKLEAIKDLIRKSKIYD